MSAALQVSESDICVNGYDFLSTEGNGNIGSVFKARKDKQIYAVKMISMNQIENLDNFIRLMEKLQRLEVTGNNNNCNIVKIHEFFQIPLNVFIVMEYCNQGNLLQYICRQQSKRLDCFKAVELFAQILNGFKFLHANKIEHRNLKPQNILMHNDKPKITDYGIYMIYNGKESQYQMREFMSPENYQVQSDQVSHLCDIWGLGVLFFFMLFGTWPFKGFDDIRAFTYEKPFNLQNLMVAKNLTLPETLHSVSDEFFTMISEIFEGLFVFESKNRMTFTKLSKHRIFLKVKNFNMEESFFFYLHAEKSLFNPQNNLNAHNKPISILANTLGLPGVSANSMYSGEMLEEPEKQSISHSNAFLQFKNVQSKRSSSLSDNQPVPEQNSELLRVLKPPKNDDTLTPKMLVSINSEVFIDNPMKYQFIHKKDSSRHMEFDLYSFNEGPHFSPLLLSSFGKMRIGHYNYGNKSVDGSPFSPSKQTLESESDFENTDEFDSLHKEANCIPTCVILKACKMVEFQFKTHQDMSLFRQIDSYSISSVISIPRPSSYMETDPQRRYIYTLYDLEIYRYRFIEETIRLLKNLYSESLSQILDYKAFVIAEHYSRKISFYIAKTLLQRIERNENFLQIDAEDFSKFMNQSCHMKFVEIIQRDLDRLYSQYYLSVTLMQSQGIISDMDVAEARFFTFDCHCEKGIKEVHCSIEKSEDNYDEKGLKYNQLISNIQTHGVQGAQGESSQDNNYLSLEKQRMQQTPSFSHKFGEERIVNAQQTVLPVIQIMEASKYHPNEMQMEFSFKDNHQLNKIRERELNEGYAFHLKVVFDKLKSEYLRGGTSSENSLKIIQLALRVAMCLRHKDIFNKNKMESLLIFFERSDNLANLGSNQFIQPVTSNSILVNNPFSNQLLINSHKTPCQSLGASLTTSNIAKSNKKQILSHSQFSIESLLKWITSCTKADLIRQIFILINEQF